MTVEFHWFGPIVALVSLGLAVFSFWFGKKKAGWTGVCVALIVLLFAYSMSGTYSPKLAIDSSTIQDIRREKSQIVSPAPEDFEDRFEERVGNVRSNALTEN